jgi:hypothetical protein
MGDTEFGPPAGSENKHYVINRRLVCLGFSLALKHADRVTRIIQKFVEDILTKKRFQIPIVPGSAVQTGCDGAI